MSMADTILALRSAELRRGIALFYWQRERSAAAARRFEMEDACVRALHGVIMKSVEGGEKLPPTFKPPTYYVFE